MPGKFIAMRSPGKFELFRVVVPLARNSPDVLGRLGELQSLPAQLASPGGEEVVVLDVHMYQQLLAETTQARAMLLRLRRVLHESGLNGVLTSGGGDASGDVITDDSEDRMDRLTRENTQLRARVAALEAELSSHRAGRRPDT